MAGTSPAMTMVYSMSRNANDHEQKARVHPASPIVSWSSHSAGTFQLDNAMVLQIGDDRDVYKARR
jgi:hypothetical protein